MRVIAGEACGRPIKAPAGMATRPTADRVRESVFNILGVDLDGRFLDVFAGSGAVGIEALSRGAEWAVFVEQSPAAVRVIRENLERLGMSDRATVLRADALRALRQMSDQERFHLAYIDPPYRTGLGFAALAQASAMVRHDGLLLVETRRESNPPEKLGVATLERVKKYGDTWVCFYQVI